MKNLTVSFIFLFLCIFNSYSQNSAVYRGVQQAKSSGERFEIVSALTPVSKNAAQSRKVEEHFFNPSEVYYLHYARPNWLNASMTLNLPLGSRSLQLELHEFTMEYEIATSSGERVPKNPNLRHYHGVVKGDPFSIVAITFAENEIIGLVATDEGNFNLAYDKQMGAHIFYNDKNMKQKPDFVCGTNSYGSSVGYNREALQQNTQSTTHNKLVRLYFETEYDMFVKSETLSASAIQRTAVGNIKNVYELHNQLFKNKPNPLLI